MEESSGSIPTDADADVDVDRSPPTGFRFSDYVYGGSVGIAVATVVFLACVPNDWLHSVGIYHYPNRYRDVLLTMPMPEPNYAVVVAIVVAIGVYIAHSLMPSSPPPTLKSMFDECSEELLGMIPADDDYQLIENLPEIDTK